mmetsp:Transcript_57110/g.140103  ORF Transcript_57110/g.140103 Transcript_57110/m.140103 type:complete len:326 (+) Transcript_57110:197-1174(+)
MLGSQLARNVAITGGAALLLLWYTVRRKRLREEEEKWPAYSEESALQNIRAITNKKTVCQWMLNATRKNGKYFRIRMLLPGEKVFVVTDVKMVRTVLSGNPELMGIEGFDKVPDGTKRFSAFTQGVPSILTKLTNGQGPVDGWSWARKSLSPAFSMRNLLKRLPTIQRRISTLEGIIRAHDARGEAIDCCEWMLRFSIDVLFSSMFNVDSDTLREDKEETLGTRALSLFRLATEEIFGKRSGPPNRAPFGQARQHARLLPFAHLRGRSRASFDAGTRAASVRLCSLRCGVGARRAWKADGWQVWEQAAQVHVLGSVDAASTTCHR